MTSKSVLRSDILLFIVGIALIVTGTYVLNENMEYFNDSIQAEGIVIDIVNDRSDSGKSGKGSSRYYPVISFKASDSQTYTFSPETGSNLGDYHTGETVMVKYNEDNPDIAKVDGFKERWALPLALISAGLLISLALGIKIYKVFYKIKLGRELPITGTRLELPGRVELHMPKGRSHYLILSDWLNPSDSRIYTFSSEKIFFDPTPYVADRLMVVWIDRRSPKKRNYMDISFLPKKI